MKNSILFTTSALALGLLAASESSASLARTEKALEALKLRTQPAQQNPAFVQQGPQQAAQDPALLAQLEQLKQQLAAAQAAAKNPGSNNNAPADQDELERLRQELAAERAAKQAAEAKHADMLNRIAALQALLAQYQAGGAPGNANGGVPAGAAAQAFMDGYANASPADREALFDAAFADMVGTGDQGSVVAMLRFILKEMQTLAAAAGNNPTQDQMDQFNRLQAMQGRIGNSPNLAPGREQHQKELDAEVIRQQRAEDKPAYDNLVGNLDAVLQTHLVDFQNGVANRDDAAHRAIPVLAYFLRINHRSLMSGNGFAAQEWAQLNSFVKYLTVEQMRAIRYHMKQGNFPATIQAPQDVKERVMSFLDTLSEKINTPPAVKPMTKGDVDNFNNNLSANLRKLLQNARVN